jgi:hypothetical protein
LISATLYIFFEPDGRGSVLLSKYLGAISMICAFLGGWAESWETPLHYNSITISIKNSIGRVVCKWPGVYCTCKLEEKTFYLHRRSVSNLVWEPKR